MINFRARCGIQWSPNDTKLIKSLVLALRLIFFLIINFKKTTSTLRNKFHTF